MNDAYNREIVEAKIAPILKNYLNDKPCPSKVKCILF